MTEPAYKNEFDKPVYKVNNLHMKHVKDQTYELQLNDQYFLIEAKQIDMLESVLALPDNISISMG